MRILSHARIAVLDADLAHRAFLCSALSELGLLQLLPAGSAEEAKDLASSKRVDLCVVDARGLANANLGACNSIPPNPFDPSRTPGILIAADANRETLKAAVASGYRVVLGAPVVPRLLYRRIGSILQRARRADRANGSKTTGYVTADLPEFQQN